MYLKATIAISSVARAMASRLLPPAGVAAAASFSSTSRASCTFGPGLLPRSLQRQGRRHGVVLVPAHALRRQSLTSATASLTQPGQQQVQANGERPLSSNDSQSNNWAQPNNGPQQSNWQQPSNGAQQSNWQQSNTGPAQSNWQQPSSAPQQNNWQQSNTGPSQSNWQPSTQRPQQNNWQQPNTVPQQNNWQQPSAAPQQGNWQQSSSVPQQQSSSAPQQSNWQQPSTGPGNWQQQNTVPQQSATPQPNTTSQPNNWQQPSTAPQPNNWQLPSTAPQPNTVPRPNTGPGPLPNTGPQPNSGPYGGGRSGPYRGRRQKQPPLYPFDDRFPITIITGWKGSGKTTVMNKICNSKPYLKVAVITNEFGEVEIDDTAITVHQTGEDHVVSLTSKDGTKSLEIREDLVVNMAELLEKKRSRRIHFDYVLVETTEKAPIVPIFNTLHVESAVAARVRIDAIVAVLDAEHALSRLNEVSEDGSPNHQAIQIGNADRIIINKVDKMSEADQDELVRRIKEINYIAQIHKTADGSVDLEFVFGARGFCRRRIEEYLEKNLPTPQEYVMDKPALSHGVRTMMFQFDGEVDLDQINDWVTKELLANKDNNFRFKGFMAISGYDNTYVFQGMGSHYEGFIDRAWENRERKYCKVFIMGRDLNERALRLGFQKCLIRRNR